MMQVRTVFAAEPERGWRFEAVSVYGSYRQSGSCSPGRHICSPDRSLVATAFTNRALLCFSDTCVFAFLRQLRVISIPRGSSE